MRVAFGSDEKSALTDAIGASLRRRGQEVALHGPLAGADEQWAEVGANVARAVAAGEADAGVLCCWTGTGVSIAANKIPGVRAALCADAETARGARRWNDANVLCLSLRSTSEAVAEEILDAWFATTEVDVAELANIQRLAAIEAAAAYAPRARAGG